MISYEVKLRSDGQITSLPDSHKIFGFLMNYSQKYFSTEIISKFTKDILEYKQKCMISNLIPTGYYPTPKEYIMEKLKENLKINSKKEVEIENIKNKLIKDLKNIKEKMENSKNENEKKELKTEFRKQEEILKENLDYLQQLSHKNIYETIKKMDFINKNGLVNLLKEKKEVTTEKLKNLDYLSQEKSFVKKIRLESNIKKLPGLDSILYSLSTISFNNKNKFKNEFSFFVKIEEGSILEEILKKLILSTQNGIIPCILGPKSSSGYNKYSIYEVTKLPDDNDKSTSLYLNLGMLLPNFENINEKNSFLDIYTSDRRPFDIENEVPKFISFITAGSIIEKENEKINIFDIGKSIHNKYNLLYKDAIIFGNSYLEKLEV